MKERVKEFNLPKFSLGENVYCYYLIGERKVIGRLFNGDYWVYELSNYDMNNVKEDDLISSCVYFEEQSTKDWEKCFNDYFRVNCIDFLPTKVIFNEAKGKTTLLFGKAPYEVTTSQISNDDVFNYSLGFKIALLKKLYNNSTQLIKHMYSIYDMEQSKELREEYLWGLITSKLLDNGMSTHQIYKLYYGIFNKSLTFNINGIEHTIEVEYK